MLCKMAQAALLDAGPPCFRACSGREPVLPGFISESPDLKAGPGHQRRRRARSAACLAVPPVRAMNVTTATSLRQEKLMIEHTIDSETKSASEATPKRPRKPAKKAKAAKKASRVKKAGQPKMNRANKKADVI